MSELLKSDTEWTAELTKRTQALVGAMATIAIVQLREFPRVPDPFGIMYPNPRKLTTGPMFIHSIASRDIAPLRYGAPAIAGGENVFLKHVTIERDTLRIRPFGREFLQVPDRPSNRMVVVGLTNPTVGVTPDTAGNCWRDDQRFGISTQGYSNYYGRTPHEQLAEAGIVAFAINAAYDKDIGVKAAERLSQAWEAHRGPLPRSQEGQPYWSPLLLP